VSIRERLWAARIQELAEKERRSFSREAQVLLETALRKQLELALEQREK
jgi:hypothetical protein